MVVKRSCIQYYSDDSDYEGINNKKSCGRKGKTTRYIYDIDIRHRHMISTYMILTYDIDNLYIYIYIYIYR